MANLRVDKITSTETFETTGSVQFGNDNALKIAANSGFDLTSNDFTMECWVYMNSVESFQTLLLYTVDGTEDDTVWQFDITSTQLRFVAYVSNSSKVYGTNFSFGSGIWYHVAATRTNDLIRLFVDGDLIGAHPFTSTLDTEASAELNIGYRNNQGTMDREVFGHLSNIRVIKGKALYTKNFNPSMKELEVTPETTLLCCQSKTDVSLEKTGKTITVNGNAVASELTPGILTPIPKAGGSSAIKGSVEFGGGTTSNPGGYLTVPNTDDLRLADSDFTVEAYINFTNGAVGDGVIVALWDNTNNQRSYNFFFDISANELSFFGSTNGSSGNNHVTASIDIENGEWYHVAASRSGSTLKLFVNGVELASNTSIGTYFDNTTDLITIGAQNHDNATNYWKGFISNLRIVKGTALYVDEFIPPTRELKKVPGTVLLCCQDPDSPLTEATGKTITGFGEFYELDENVDLSTTASWVDGSTGAGSASESNGELTMQGNDASNRGIISKTVTEGIRPGVTYQMSFEVFDAASNGKLGLDSNDGTNDVLDDPTATIDMVHFSGSDLDGNTGIFTVEGVATTHQVVMYFQEFGAAGTTEFKVRNITLRAVNANEVNVNKASNFTPQVGDDRKVALDGNTKVSTENYFYLPTGNTYTRDSRYGRGLIVGGSTSNAIEYINITTQSNSQEFGDLRSATSYVSACSSSTRGICVVSRTPSTPNGGNTIDYVTLATTGNSQEFGVSTSARYELAAAANNTRGLIAGGYTGPGSGTPANSDVIDYVTIASTGDAIDFGNLTHGRRGVSGLSSPIRACFAAGYRQPDTTSEVDIIDYVTIASTGNALDFGNLSAARWGCGSMASSTRGMWAGGIDPNATNAIDYVTISSKGNVQDFGDLTSAPSDRTSGGMSNSIRGVVCLGGTNSLNYITISTTGNAEHFGDTLRSNAGVRGGCSDSHGGLG